MGKNYATTTTRSSVCSFKCDYSYYTNHECLGCKFCYRLLPHDPKPKKRPANLLNIEKDYNKSLYCTPVTLSRYCDPFANKKFTENSLIAMENILSNGGQIILRTSQKIPHEGVNILAKYKGSVQLQLRAFSTSSDMSMAIQGELAPSFMPYSLLWDNNWRARLLCDTALLFDPLILGVNDVDLIRILRHGSPGKVIIGQLYATPQFKAYLTSVDRTKGALLNQPVGDYWTYDNVDILRAIEPAMVEAAKYDVSVSFCNNKYLNMILGIESNCCQRN